MVRVGPKGGKMVLNLTKTTDPILHTRLKQFDFSDESIDRVELVNNLIETMIHHKGIGLSANQCGLPHRVFVAHSNPTLVMFNPKIVDETVEQVKLDEGCVSYPNLFLPIKRAKVIKVRFQDINGEVHTEKYIGMTARVIQHELDHLNGIDYTRRANKIHLERAMNQKKILDRQLKRLRGLGRDVRDIPVRPTGASIEGELSGGSHPSKGSVAVQTKV